MDSPRGGHQGANLYRNRPNWPKRFGYADLRCMTYAMVSRVVIVPSGR
jgi:hypothetical protein